MENHFNFYFYITFSHFFIRIVLLPFLKNKATKNYNNIHHTIRITQKYTIIHNVYNICTSHTKKKNLLSQYSVLAKAYKIIKFNNDDVQITRIVIYRKK